MGSSPRVRGKRRGDGREQYRVRLIPARAGKTGEEAVDVCEVRAHPRACGENRTIVAWRLPAAGSSPRVRGKRAVSRGRAWHRGLIPARAGKTAALGSVCGFAWAHPRACGENVSGI